MSIDRRVTLSGTVQGNVVITGNNNVVIVESSVELAARGVPSSIPSPYRGLAAFRESDKANFFGREELTEALWSAFRELHSSERGAHVRLLPVVGVSGSGKSSIVRAGLLPRLSTDWLPGALDSVVVVITPGARPVTLLAQTLLRLKQQENATEETIEAVARDLRARDSSGRHDGLTRLVDTILEPTSRLVVFVDQFEEVYSVCQDDVEREVFLGCLLSASDSDSGRVSVVVALRSDFVHETYRDPAMRGVLAERAFTVTQMTPDQLRRCIAEPAKRAGRPLGNDTVELLVSYTDGREGALPLLEFALTRLWDALERDSDASAVLQRIGGVGGALALAAQSQFESLPSDQQRTARRLFLSLVQLGEGVSDSRRRVKLSDLVAHAESESEVRRILEHFSAQHSRVVTLSSDSAHEVTAELTHEALISHWDSLKSWLDADRSQLRLHRRATEAAHVWQRNGRNVELLWRGPDLQLLTELQRRSPDTMTALELVFLRASHRRVQTTRGRRILAACILVGLFVAVVLALTRVNEQANRQELVANDLLSQFDVDRGVGFLVNGNCMGLLDLLKSIRAVDGSTGARAARMSLWAGWHQTCAGRLAEVAGHTTGMKTATFSADGKSFVTTSEAGEIGIWETSSGKQLGPPMSNETFLISGVNRVRMLYGSHLADRGRSFIAATAEAIVRYDLNTGAATTLQWPFALTVATEFDGAGDLVVLNGMKGVRVHSTRDGSLVRELDAGQLMTLKVVISPDGQLVATLAALNANTAALRVWRLSDGRRIGADIQRSSTMLTFVPGTHVLATTPHTGQLELINVDGLQLRPRQPIEIGPVSVYGFIGEALATSTTKDVRLWNLTTGSLIDSLPGVSLLSAGQVSSADNRVLPVVAGDRIMKLWDIPARRFQCVSIEMPSRPMRASFSRDGRFIAVAGQDNAVRVWNRTTCESSGKAYQHQAEVSELSFSPDSTRLLTASLDGTAKVWDLEQPSQVTWHDPSTRGADLAIDSTGTLLAASGSKDVKIIEISSGKVLRALHHDDTVSALAFAGDSGLLITGTASQSVALWSTRTGDRVRTLVAGTRAPSEREDRSVLLSTNLDGTVVATVSAKGNEAVLWSVGSGQAMSRVDHGSEIAVLCFDSRGRRLATAGNDGSVKIWNVGDGHLLAEYSVPYGLPSLNRHRAVGIRSAVFSADGNYFAAASEDGTAHLWDVANWAGAGVLLRHQGPVVSVAFSPDSSIIATASLDGTAQMWNTRTGHPFRAPLRHRDSVSSVRFTADGKLIATVSADGTGALWDVATGQPWGDTVRSPKNIASIVFDPRGRYLAVASTSEGLFLRRLPSVSYSYKEAEDLTILALGTRVNAYDGVEIVPWSDWQALRAIRAPTNSGR